MTLDRILHSLPMLLFAAAGVAFAYMLVRYKRKNDQAAWVAKLTADASRAAGDEIFRKGELVAADAALAGFARPGVILPIRRNQEVYVQTLPGLVMVTGMGAAALIFLGLFMPRGEGRMNWEMYAGPALLAVTALLFLVVEKARSSYGRVQQLNRKYLLHKAGGETGPALEAMREILEYYPEAPGLRLEYADQFANAGRLDDAIAEVNKARKIAPDNADLMIVEMSLHLRNGALDTAGRILKQLRDMPLAPSDPRREIFAAAMDLRRGNRDGAVKNLETAVDLDKAFTTMFLSRDKTLAELNRLAGETGMLEDKEEEPVRAG